MPRTKTATKASTKSATKSASASANTQISNDEKNVAVLKTQNTSLEEEETSISKHKRGRPKGTTGTRRPDCSYDNPSVKKGDNARYIRHALASLNLPPIDISDAKQVDERINWYFDHCIDEDMKPTVKGMCNALGVDKQTVRNWVNGTYRAGKGTEHLDSVKRAYDMLEELYEDYMLNGKINPASGIFMGKNHFGYTDQQEVILTPNDPLGDETSEKALKSKYLEDIGAKPIDV